MTNLAGAARRRVGTGTGGDNPTAPLSGFVQAFHSAWHSKCTEPLPRNKDGMRWITHRFPIKGGISLHEVVVRSCFRHNALLTRLTSKASP